MPKEGGDLCRSAIYSVADLTFPVVLCLSIALGGFIHPALAAGKREMMPASDFAQIIGVNVHMSYTDGAYVNVPAVLEALRFLGVNYVRDVLPDIHSAAAMHGRDALRRLIFSGIRLNLFFPAGWQPSSTLDLLQNLEKAVPGAVQSVEGYNEINNFPVSFQGQTGAQAAAEGQQSIYRAIKSNADLKHIPVIDMTGFDEKTYGSSLEGYADVMNIHAYAQNGMQPGNWISPERVDAYKSLKQDLPKVITEFGYASMPQSGWLIIGVDELTQAKGILNGIFDAARSGYDKIYIYELLDQKPDENSQELEHHFGLFTFGGRPKIVAQAIRSMSKIFAEGSRGNKPQMAPSATDLGVLAVSAPSSDVPIHTLRFPKTDGTEIIAAWREPSFWDRSSGRPVEVPAVEATLHVGKTCHKIKQYDILKPGEIQSNELAPASADGAVLLKIADYPQLLECFR